MIKAKIVADSKNQQGNRITTMLVTFPRFILAELNTHRMLSKNSASSRAIPFKKMVESVQNNPFIPIAWQKEHSGMQGSEYFSQDDIINWANMSGNISASKGLTELWLEASMFAIDCAKGLNRAGLTKQLCNRLLEPFMWHTVLISGTEWENFFELRCPEYHYHGTGKTFRSKKDFLKANPFEDGVTATEEFFRKINKGQAEIHMMALAEAMWDAMNESKPKELKAGEWHIPFEDKIDITDRLAWDNSTGELIEAKVKISTAMAARTSYTVVGDEKEFSYEKQIELHDRMVNQVPFHASPFEHCAIAMSNEEYNTFVKGKCFYQEVLNAHVPIGNSLGWCRNFKGFIQYREILENNK